MKRLFYLFAAIAMLFATGCDESGSENGSGEEEGGVLGGVPGSVKSVTYYCSDGDYMKFFYTYDDSERVTEISIAGGDWGEDWDGDTSVDMEDIYGEIIFEYGSGTLTTTTNYSEGDDVQSDDEVVSFVLNDAGNIDSYTYYYDELDSYYSNANTYDYNDDNQLVKYEETIVYGDSNEYYITQTTTYDWSGGNIVGVTTAFVDNDPLSETSRDPVSITYTAYPNNLSVDIMAGLIFDGAHNLSGFEPLFGASTENLISTTSQTGSNGTQVTTYSYTFDSDGVLRSIKQSSSSNTLYWIFCIEYNE